MSFRNPENQLKELKLDLNTLGKELNKKYPVAAMVPKPPTPEQMDRFAELSKTLLSQNKLTITSLPKSAKECRERLQRAQTSAANIRAQQVKLSSELVELVKLDASILTPDNLKALTGLVALGGKEMLPLLTAVVKEEPSKEVIERASKIGLFAWLYDQLLNFFNEKLNKQEEK